MLYQLAVGDFRRPLVPGWEREVPDELLREDIIAATDGDPAHRLASVGVLADRLRRRTAHRRGTDYSRRPRRELASSRSRRVNNIVRLIAELRSEPGIASSPVVLIYQLEKVLKWVA